MRCAWDELLMILPNRLRQEVDERGRESMEELRLRQGAPPELVLRGTSCWLKDRCSREDLAFVIQAASRYSPWSMDSVKQGYLTARGGHRIGLCGLGLYQKGIFRGLREITSVCIRVARDYPGIAAGVPGEGSVLILGAPGWGKTTLLRDLIRLRSEQGSVAVVDQRGELFPPGFDVGKRTDVLLGCRKVDGLDMVIRTMGPRCIAVDEVTAEEDCHGLVRAANCGVTLLATAHAGSKEEFFARPVYRMLIQKEIFSWLLILKQDKSHTVERMNG